jgi:uncharacterized protein
MKASMSETPDTPVRGFQFPGTFEVTVFGEASPELQGVVLAELSAAGVVPDAASLRTRDSRGGRFLAVTVSFWSEDRGHHDAAYARLRAHPAVKWTL